MWYQLYDESNQPTWENIKEYVNNELWDELCTFIQNAYEVSPRIEYSKCSMQKGWNIKYKKRGKSICTLYPEKGFFIVLIVIGEKEQSESELVIPSCNAYIQNLYEETPFSCGGRWLMIEVKDKSTLEDVFKFIQVRASR